jgi:hypothetical protein
LVLVHVARDKIEHAIRVVHRPQRKKGVLEFTIDHRHYDQRCPLSESNIDFYRTLLRQSGTWAVTTFKLERSIFDKMLGACWSASRHSTGDNPQLRSRSKQVSESVYAEACDCASPRLRQFHNWPRNVQIKLRANSGSYIIMLAWRTEATSMVEALVCTVVS